MLLLWKVILSLKKSLSFFFFSLLLSFHYIFQTDYLGTLEVGKFADFILLSKNIMSPDLPPQDILQTSILETYVGGSLVYKSEGGERGEGCLKRRGERDRGDYRQPHH